MFKNITNSDSNTESDIIDYPGGSRRTGPAQLGASFIYALLSKNAVNRGFLRFSKSMK